MGDITTASDGTELDLGNLAQVFVFSGNFISTITVSAWSLKTNALRNFVQTFTNNGTHITNISGWIAQ